MNRVLRQQAGPVGTMVMNHPQRRNALSQELIGELLDALIAFQVAKSRVVVLRAAAGADIWSAGHDVHELPKSGRDPLAWDDPLRQLVRAIEDFPAPVIALVDGGVWGGACEVAMACDVVVATPRSTFAITPAKLGIPYNLSGLLTFMSRAPLALVKEMAFTAQPMTAERAGLFGIVNHVVAEGEVEVFVQSLVDRIAANAPLSIRAMKEEIRVLASAHAMTPRMFERIQGLRRIVYDSHDYQEGIRAFLEKRPASFLGE
jgi:methylmalonyl-CoA decarboxylase